MLDTERRFTEAASGFNNSERSEHQQTARQLQRTLDDMVVIATRARECSDADETCAEDRTDRTAECLRGDQGRGQKADRGANACSDGGGARNPATCTGDSTAT